MSGHFGWAFYHLKGTHVEGVLIGTFFSSLLFLTLFFVTMELARKLSIIHYLVLSRLGRNCWLVQHGNAGRLKRTENLLDKERVASFSIIVSLLSLASRILHRASRLTPLVFL
jgi:hypothetical protein